MARTRASRGASAIAGALITGALLSSAGFAGMLGASLVGATATAEAHYINCDSVRGRHMRIRDQTRYNTALGHAVAEWDSLGGPHVFIGEGDPHLYVSDYRAHDGLNGYYTCSEDRVRLNMNELETRTANGDKNTVTHELGHALHLGHSYSGQLMEGVENGYTTPQGHDRKDFRDLWVINGGCTHTGESVRSETGVDARSSSGPVTDLLDTCAGGPTSSPFGNNEPARPEVSVAPVDSVVPTDENVENPGAYASWLAQQILICSRPVAVEFDPVEVRDQTDQCFLIRDLN